LFVIELFGCFFFATNKPESKKTTQKKQNHFGPTGWEALFLIEQVDQLIYVAIYNNKLQKNGIINIAYYMKLPFSVINNVFHVSSIARQSNGSFIRAIVKVI
jgi:hypothetical protein